MSAGLSSASAGNLLHAAGLPHPPSCALRQRPRSRGPRVSGNGRSRQLPGPIRVALSVDRRRDVRSRGPLSVRAAAAAGARGADAGVVDRLANRRSAKEDGQPVLARPGRLELELVAAALALRGARSQSSLRRWLDRCVRSISSVREHVVSDVVLTAQWLGRFGCDE